MSATIDIPVGEGLLTRDQARKWTEAQIAYPNLVGRRKIRENVKRWVSEEVKTFEGKTQHLQKRWRLLTHVLRGNSVARTASRDVHVPEMYKLLETLVPRIEEAVTEFDPWFMLMGRDAEDRDIADLRASFLDWQLDQMGWSKLQQPAIRSMLVYQIAVGKMRWDRKFMDVPEREVVRGDDGQVTKIRRRITEKVVYEGPSMELVNPFDFIIDTHATGAADALYIGDHSYMTLGEIQLMAKRGLFDKKQVETLKERKPKSAPASQRAWNKQSMMVTEWSLEGQKHNPGSPKMFQVTDIWCLFDLYDDKREVETVLTVVDGDVPVQARENFYDRKIRPYAIARAAKEAWGFFNTGIFDHSLRTQYEYDKHRANILAAHDLQVCPLVFTEQFSDLPTSIFGIKPGTVFQGVGKVQFGQFPNTLGNATALSEMFRRDMEEEVGAPRLLGGGEAGNTATEVERRSREANRRIRGMVRSFSDFGKSALEIMDAMNQQFVISDIAFRVLGKRAKKIGSYGSIGPEVFLRDVDFEIVGLQDLHTVGSRATGLMNYMQLMMPIIQTHPDDFNVLAMAKELYGSLVSRRLEDEVISSKDNLDDLMPQQQENALLAKGIRIAVSKGDDDDQHIQIMRDTILSDKQWKDTDPNAKKIVMEHLFGHVAQKQQKEAAESERQRRLQQRQELAPEAGGQSGPNGASPAAGGFSPALTPGGQTPGPADPNRTSSVGRADQGIPQSRNVIA